MGFMMESKITARTATVARTLYLTGAHKVSAQEVLLSEAVSEKEGKAAYKVWFFNKTLDPVRQAAKAWLACEDRSELFADFLLTAATYQAFADVSMFCGRLLALQNSVTREQIERRMIEKHGEKPSVIRSTRNALATLVEWGVLAREDRYTYCAEQPRAVRMGLAAMQFFVLAMAQIMQAEKFLRIKEVLHHPMLFGFALDHYEIEQALRQNFDVGHTGFDGEVYLFHSKRPEGPLTAYRGFGS